MKPDKTSKSFVRAPDSGSCLLRLKEVIGEKPVASFARDCGVGESTLRNILAGAWPRTDILVSIADCGGVSVDWLAVGRLPKHVSELRELLQRPPDTAMDERHVVTLMQAFQVLQEWQIENGRFLSTDKFLRAAELLVELAGDKPEQVKQHAAQVLRLAA